LLLHYKNLRLQEKERSKNQPKEKENENGKEKSEGGVSIFKTLLQIYPNFSLKEILSEAVWRKENNDYIQFNFLKDFSKSELSQQLKSIIEEENPKERLRIYAQIWVKHLKLDHNKKDIRIIDLIAQLGFTRRELFEYKMSEYSLDDEEIYIPPLLSFEFLLSIENAAAWKSTIKNWLNEGNRSTPLQNTVSSSVLLNNSSNNKKATLGNSKKILSPKDKRVNANKVASQKTPSVVTNSSKFSKDKPELFSHFGIEDRKKDLSSIGTLSFYSNIGNGSSSSSSSSSGSGKSTTTGEMDTKNFGEECKIYGDILTETHQWYLLYLLDFVPEEFALKMIREEKTTEKKVKQELGIELDKFVEKVEIARNKLWF